MHHDPSNQERAVTLSILDMVSFPVLRHIEPQAPLPVVVWVETIPLCQGHVFATRLQRPWSFPDTSGTRKIQQTGSANDCFNVLDKRGFVFSVASFQNCPVFRRD